VNRRAIFWTASPFFPFWREKQAQATYKANFRISYADAFVAAAAAELEATIVTGDPEFAAIESKQPVEWLK
jgi:predicted nucleic acid-binding protein